MAIFGRKKAQQITREQVLSSRPFRNPQLKVTRTEDDGVAVKIPRRKIWWVNLFAKLGRVPEYRLLTLDRVGTSVWDMCDGEHTVSDLIGQLAGEHQLSRKEAELSLVTYLRQLAERGVVVLLVEEEEKVEGGSKAE